MHYRIHRHSLAVCNEYTMTVYFKRNTCTPAHLCSYPFSQSCDSCTLHKTTLFTTPSKWEKCVSYCSMVAARWAGILENPKEIFNTAVCQVYTEWCQKKLRKWMFCLVENSNHPICTNNSATNKVTEKTLFLHAMILCTVPMPYDCRITA